MFYLNFRVLKLMFLAFPRAPGGCRELREADRNRFHLFWYLLPRYRNKQIPPPKKADKAIIYGWYTFLKTNSV